MMRTTNIFLLLAATFSFPANADIYIHRDSQEPDASVIHLTNLPQEDFVVLVAAPQTQPKLQARVLKKTFKAPAHFSHAVTAASRETGLKPALLHAVIAAESGYNPSAVSSKGAQGLMQLMPSTSRALRITYPHDPASNIFGGAKYLKGLLDQFGSIELALAAYNAGPATVARYGNRIPPYAETQQYVRKVLALAGME